MKYVGGLLAEKNNISEQLRLLKKHKDNPYVKDYMERLENYEHLSGYVRYMIDKYYYNLPYAEKCKKNCVERNHKVILRLI